MVVGDFGPYYVSIFEIGSREPGKYMQRGPQMRPLSPGIGIGEWRPYWLADDAVQCEPVSAPNSLLTGKNTGKFAKLRCYGVRIASDLSIPWAFLQFSLRSRTGNFGRQNREGSGREQGILSLRSIAPPALRMRRRFHDQHRSRPRERTKPSLLTRRRHLHCIPAVVHNGPHSR
jgi:hypothetical protein